MDRESIVALIKDELKTYLKENLTIDVRTSVLRDKSENSSYTKHKIEVTVMLDGETIAESFDTISIDDP